MTKSKVKGIAIALAMIAFAIGANVLLNAGCAGPLHTGVITAHGRACI